MKKIYINDLKSGVGINGEVFAIYDVKKAEDRNGKTYYDLVIGDKTGQLKAKIWSDALSRIDEAILKPNCLVTLYGKIDEYRGMLQVTITAITKCEDEIGFEDFVAVSEYPTEEMFSELMLEVESIQNTEIRQVLKEILSDSEIQNRYKYWPAASSVHHDFKSGLLQHVLEMLTISKSMKRFYPNVDYDVLTAGIILHDIGKIEEFDAEGLTTSYSRKGSLIGHITIGVLIWNKFAGNKVSEEIYLHIAHLILSHHGKLEMGSPIMPATVEAFMLSNIDNLSSKARTAQKYVGEITEDEEFTTFIRWLDGTRLWKGTSGSVTINIEDVNIEEENGEGDDEDIDSDQIPLV